MQFGSVDNGVIQGAISEIDSKTGKPGDFMAFKAVHESVSGAGGFSGQSASIADSEGGVYRVSTGASTSFFAPGGFRFSKDNIKVGYIVSAKHAEQAEVISAGPVNVC